MMNTHTYPFNLGEHRGFILNDASRAHFADELIANPIIEELEQLSKEYSFDIDQIPVDYNVLLVKVGSQNVLVDAGIPGLAGNLTSGLGELGIDRGNIQTIVITHTDLDHIGGILDGEGRISFPNSRYIMLEDAWQYWSSDERRAELATLNKWTQAKAQFAWEILSSIENLICLVKPGEEFIAGMQLFPAPGHRYDHSVLRIISANEQLMHLSDALAHPLFMAKRDWYSTYDADPARAVATKVKLLDMCTAENALVFGTHFPFPGLGYVQRERERWNWQPIGSI